MHQISEIAPLSVVSNLRPFILLVKSQYVDEGVGEGYKE